MVCWYRFLIAIPSFVMMLCALSYMAGLCGAPSRPREQWIDAGNTGHVSSNVPLDSAEVRDGIPPPMCIACNAAPQRRPYDYCGGLTTCLNAAEEAISAAGATTAAPTAPPAHLPAAMAPGWDPAAAAPTTHLVDNPAAGGIHASPVEPSALVVVAQADAGMYTAPVMPSAPPADEL